MRPVVGCLAAVMVGTYLFVDAGPSLGQAPARPDEDTRGGFERGGWALPYNDAVKDYPYDPEAAKKLLAEAGLAKGFEKCSQSRRDEA